MTTLDIDGSTPTRNGNGWKKHLTIDRVLLLVTLLFSSGQYWERQQQTTVGLTDQMRGLTLRVDAAELRVANVSADAASTYVRQDVIEVRLRAIEREIGEIKELLRRREP